MRPIRPDDAPALKRFHRRLTPKSIYRRYFYLHPDLSPSELDHLTRVDYVLRLALIVEDAGCLVAVGRYDRVPGTADAEVAFVVADAHQHMGLGTLLLGQLAAAARRNGISQFRATVLAENRAMVDVFKGSGCPVATHDDLGVISVRMRLLPEDRRASAPSLTVRSPHTP